MSSREAAPLSSGVGSMRITRSRGIHASKAVCDSSLVKIEPNDDEFVVKEENDEDWDDSKEESEAEKKMRLEKKNQRSQKKRVEEIDDVKKMRLEKRSEERRQKRANEAAAEKEERERSKTMTDAERKRMKRAQETESEREERLRKSREQKKLKYANLSEAEKKERHRKIVERKKLVLSQMTEEEKKERNRQKLQAKFFRWEAKKASMTPEEVEHAEFQRKMNNYMSYVARNAVLTPEEKEKQREAMRRYNRERFESLSEEKRKEKLEKRRAYHKSIPAEKKSEYSRKACSKYTKKLKETNPAKWKQIYDNMIESNRRNLLKETPEKRHKRLLRYKVYQAKRKARAKLEAEGVSPEEIERRLEEVVNQVRETDRLERKRNPVDTADYKPRENARKPKEMDRRRRPRTATVTSSQPELESEAVPPQEIIPLHTTLLTKAPTLDYCLPPKLSSRFETASSTKVEWLEENKEKEHHDFSKYSETFPESSAHDNDDVDNDEPMEADYFSEPASPDQVENPTSLITEPPFLPEVRIKDEICEDDSEPSPISVTQTPVGKADVPQLNSASTTDEPPEQLLPTTTEKEQANKEEPPPSPPPSPSSSPLPMEPENEKVEEEKVICHECGKLLRRPSLKFHKFIFHNPNYDGYKCPKCEGKFANARSLWDHYLNFHEETLNSEQGESQQVKLNIVGNPSAVPTQSEQEKKPRKDKIENGFVCEHCGSKYSTKAVMAAHVKRVHFEQRFICEVCNKEEQTAGKLWRHKITRHPEIETPAPAGMVICEYCTEPVLRSYQYHVKKFHPEIYDEFVKRDPIMEKIYSVSQRKKRRGTLSDVTRSHKTKCSECDLEIRLDSMKRHMRNVHGQNTKSYACGQCGKSFKQNYSLNEHIRIVHNSIDRKIEEYKLVKTKTGEDGVIINSCSVCDKKIFGRKDINAHLLTSHFDLYELLKKPGNEAELEKYRVNCEVETPATTPKKTKENPPKKPIKKVKYEDVNSDECGQSIHPRAQRRLKHQIRKKLPADAVAGFKCLRCDAKFVGKPELIEHVQSEHPGSYWPCSHCDLFGYSEHDLKNHLLKCDKNPENGLLPVKIEKSAKKKCSKRKTSRKNRQREESETEEETESDDEDYDLERSRSPVGMVARKSSRVQSKQPKKTGKRLKAKFAQGSFNDDKLKKQVKVLVERLTKEQIEFYVSRKC